MMSMSVKPLPKGVMGEGYRQIGEMTRDPTNYHGREIDRRQSCLSELCILIIYSCREDRDVTALVRDLNTCMPMMDLTQHQSLTEYDSPDTWKGRPWNLENCSKTIATNAAISCPASIVVLYRPSVMS